MLLIDPIGDQEFADVETRGQELPVKETTVDRTEVPLKPAILTVDAAGEGSPTATQLHCRYGRSGLLLNWNESRTHREEIAASFAHRQVECFVTKPIGEPDEEISSQHHRA